MRAFLVISAALALAACASAPAPDAGDVATHLTVCPGGGSNLPAVDGRRRVVGYVPLARVNGVSLLRAPVSACVSSGFGPRRGGAGSFHEGLDLYTGRPAPVLAGGDGVVSFIGKQRGYGRIVVIAHRGGVETRYAHLSSVAGGLRAGKRVLQGTVIGRTGDSGNATAVHLHYEILVRGRPADPLAVGR